MNRNRKHISILLVLLSFLFLTGFGLLDVELKTEPGELLIDLDKVVQGIGKPGNPLPSAGTEGETESDTESQEEEPEEEEDFRDAVTVKVSFTTIYLEDELCSNTSALTSRISLYPDADTVVLLDDYAEAHVLRGVRKVLEAKGIKVKYERMD